MKKVASVDEYLESVPKEMRTALNKLRRTIKAAAPDAEEVISYRHARVPAERNPGVLCRVQRPLQLLPRKRYGPPSVRHRNEAVRSGKRNTSLQTRQASASRPSYANRESACGRERH